jgi:hypothetical protein
MGKWGDGEIYLLGMEIYADREKGMKIDENSLILSPAPLRLVYLDEASSKTVLSLTYRFFSMVSVSMK